MFKQPNFKALYVLQLKMQKCQGSLIIVLDLKTTNKILFQ